MKGFHVNKRKFYCTVLISFLLLSCLSIFSVQASSADWSMPRPSKDRSFYDVIGNAATDGTGSVGIGVEIFEYDESESPDREDRLDMKVSVSANSREEIEYNYWKPFTYSWYDVSNPTGITGDNSGSWFYLTPLAPHVSPVLFHGVEYTSVWVSSDGFVSFNHPGDNLTPSNIPNPEKPNTLIAPFWRDLKPNLGGSITYGVVSEGDALVISWNNVPDASGNPQTFQVVIKTSGGGASENTHHLIFFQYDSITKDQPTTIGIENQAGSKGTSIDLNDLGNDLCIKLYYSPSYQLKQLKMRLVKSDTVALIDILPNKVGGHNVILENYDNPYGSLYLAPISLAAELFLGALPLGPVTGVICGALVITGETAIDLAGELSPPQFESQSAGPYETEAYIRSECLCEHFPKKPFDATLAATVIWSFTDPNDRDHFLTVTAEATYQSGDLSEEYTISTSVTLNMYTGAHYLDVHTSLIGGPETTGVKVWIDGNEHQSPVSSLIVSEGIHTIEVESPIYRNSIKYKFEAWLDDGTDNPITIEVDSDIDLTALYDEWYCLSISVHCDPPGGGTIDPEPGTHDYVEGSIITVTAITNESDGFWFSHWDLDGDFYFDTQITVTMDSNHDLEAFFFKSCNLSISVSSTPSGHGTTSPLPGIHTYLYGRSVEVTATPDGEVVFTQWILDGQCGYYANPITVSMDSDHSLTAVFLPPPTGGGDGCPTLFVWNGTGYVDYGVIDIHDASGEDVVEEVSVETEDVGLHNYKAYFRLREGWPGLNFSESVIDQVKLYAVDNSGNRHLCPLISATHSRLGNVWLELLFSDDIRSQILLLETIDLKFIVPYQDIQSFTFIIEGCNQFKQ